MKRGSKLKLNNQKNTSHPLSPTSKKARRRKSAQERQDRWDSMSASERLFQLELRGCGETAEAEALR